MGDIGLVLCDPFMKAVTWYSITCDFDIDQAGQLGICIWNSLRDQVNVLMASGQVEFEGKL